MSRADDQGVVFGIMEVLGGNLMSHNAKQLLPEFEDRSQLAAAAIRWALQDERVSMLNIGASFATDIDVNKMTLQGDLAVTSQVLDLLAEFSGKAYETEMVKAMKTV